MRWLVAGILTTSLTGCWSIPPASFFAGERLSPIWLDLPEAEYEPRYSQFVSPVVTPQDLIVFGEEELVAVDASGEVHWRFSHGPAYSPSSFSHVELAPSGFFATGIVTLSPYFNDPPQHYVVHLSESGELIWRIEYEARVNPERSNDEEGPLFTAIAAMPDGGFVAAGGGLQVEEGYPLLIVRGDAEGNILWTYEGLDDLSDIYVTDARAWGTGGELLLVGIRPRRSGTSEVVFLKVTADGELEWVRPVEGVIDSTDYYYYGYYYDIDTSRISPLAPLPDQSFAVAAARGYDSGVASILKIDPSGETSVLPKVVSPRTERWIYEFFVLGLEFVDGEYILGLGWDADYPHFSLYTLDADGGVLEERSFSRSPVPYAMASLSDGRRVFTGSGYAGGPFSNSNYRPFLLVD